ncbi:hypothetical protein [Methylocystis parvus]|uniref:hypothetical protein n=1 Tax=Methylocystis parvus TaxID=134 RepID=UPI003C7820FD
MTKVRLLIAQQTVFAAALAQAIYWFCTVGLLGFGLLPLDLIFLWMVLPALILSAIGVGTPMGAGFATGAFVLNVFLLALLAAS